MAGEHDALASRIMKCKQSRKIYRSPMWSWLKNGRDCAYAISSGGSTSHYTVEDTSEFMHIEKIIVRATESGKTMQVVVLSKHANRIQIVLGEGVHSVKCELTPTPNRTAFSGKALGREIVYERSPEQVQADLDRLDPSLKRSRPR